MSGTNPDDRVPRRVLRHFFERRLADRAVSDDRRPCTRGRCKYLIPHLVERTIGRAALRRAVRRPLGTDATPVGSWKETLRAAALTELRRLPRYD